MKIFHQNQSEFPQQVRDMKMTGYDVTYSNHAKRASQSDRYGKITLPSTIYFSGSQVVEVEVDNDKIIKYLVRLPYSDGLDSVFAITSDNYVKTVWLNQKTDNHSTLDLSKYSKGE